MFALGKLYLADAVKGAEQDLIKVPIVQQICLLINNMLHHGIYLQDDSSSGSRLQSIFSHESAARSELFPKPGQFEKQSVLSTSATSL